MKRAIEGGEREHIQNQYGKENPVQHRGEVVANCRKLLAAFPIILPKYPTFCDLLRKVVVGAPLPPCRRVSTGLHRNDACARRRCQTRRWGRGESMKTPEK